MESGRFHVAAVHQSAVARAEEADAHADHRGRLHGGGVTRASRSALLHGY